MKNYITVKDEFMATLESRIAYEYSILKDCIENGIPTGVGWDIYNIEDARYNINQMRYLLADIKESKAFDKKGSD